MHRLCILIKFRYLEPRATSGRGRLTERLLAQGLLTQTMLEELQSEWNQQSTTDFPKPLPIPTKRDIQPGKKSIRRKRKP